MSFSQLKIMKNNYRSCLYEETLQVNLRIANITSDIDLLCKNMQFHPSH